MNQSSVIVATRVSNRVLATLVLVVTIYLVTRWTSDLHVTSGPTLPKRTSPRFVSMCSKNLVGSRRLGNQLFNYAAMLYVAKLTGTL